METLRTYIQDHFGLIQLGISAAFILFWLRSRAKEASQSRFKLREADRNLNFMRHQPGSKDAEQAAKKERKKDPLRLSGIVKDGASHEVLGVLALASESEIQKAYKEKMKQYHPDRIGRPGSPEWTEATGIAESINRARLDMLARLKRRG